jgi:hypothetical protein
MLEEGEERALIVASRSELDCGHEASTADRSDDLGIALGKLGEARQETLAFASRIVAEPATRERVEDGKPDPAGDVVVGKGGRVPEGEPFVPEGSRRETPAEGEEAAAERFSNEQNIGRDALVLARKEAPRPSKACLHLIEDERNAILRAEISDTPQIARRRQMNTALALDRLQEECRDSVAVPGEAGGKRLGVAEFNPLEARRKRAEALGILRLARDREGT